MLKAEKELSLRGSSKATAGADLLNDLRERTADHMQAQRLNYKQVAESAGIDHSLICKFMKGKVGLTLGLCTRLERILTDNHGESISDLAGLADAIACRLLQGDGRISTASLTRYENEVRQCNQ